LDPSKFGPFASVVAIVAALSAVFSLVLLRALGNINRWTWLTDDSPSFIVTAAARIAAIVSMALAFVAIGRGNSLWFAAAALVLAALAFVAIASGRST
jgi:hypothetical protein